MPFPTFRAFRDGNSTSEAGWPGLALSRILAGSRRCFGIGCDRRLAGKANPSSVLRSDVSFPSLGGFLLLAAVSGLAAGCQTSGEADPNSTLTTRGDFQELANCYAASQSTVATRPVSDGAGTRAVSVTITNASPAAESALGGASTAAQEAVQGTGVASYRVTFQELPGNMTRVSGLSVGAATKPFTWFETVLPALRTCARNPDLR